MRPGLRFAVLTRDNYTCRYCGAKAPEVPLHVDHVLPKSRGGKDVMENLVTSCRPCNLGKHASLTEQAAPELTWEACCEEIDALADDAHERFLGDLAGICNEWIDITGVPPSPRLQVTLARMLLASSFAEIRRAMYASARRSGYRPGLLCECTGDEDCGNHATLDPFELRLMVRRWHEDWLA